VFTCSRFFFEKTTARAFCLREQNEPPRGSDPAQKIFFSSTDTNNPAAAAALESRANTADFPIRCARLIDFGNP